MYGTGGYIYPIIFGRIGCIGRQMDYIISVLYKEMYQVINIRGLGDANTGKQ